MSLLELIKRDQLTARKDKTAKDVASLLTTLIGEASMIGKNDGNRESTDAEVIAVIKKFIKNNKELADIVDKTSDAHQHKALTENIILGYYLPKQMSEEDIRKVVQSHIETLEEVSPKAMGLIMKLLKDNYGGRYDGKMASKVVKELLS